MQRGLDSVEVLKLIDYISKHNSWNNMAKAFAGNYPIIKYYEMAFDTRTNDMYQIKFHRPGKDPIIFSTNDDNDFRESIYAYLRSKPTIELIIVTDRDKTANTDYYRMVFSTINEIMLKDSILVMNNFAVKEYTTKYKPFLILCDEGPHKTDHISADKQPVLQFTDIDIALENAIAIQYNVNKKIVVICDPEEARNILEMHKIDSINVRLIEDEMYTVQDLPNSKYISDIPNFKVRTNDIIYIINKNGNEIPIQNIYLRQNNSEEA